MCNKKLNRFYPTPQELLSFPFPNVRSFNSISKWKYIILTYLHNITHIILKIEMVYTSTVVYFHSSGVDVNIFYPMSDIILFLSITKCEQAILYLYNILTK